jgi:hypothetical protein
MRESHACTRGECTHTSMRSERAKHAAVEYTYEHMRWVKLHICACVGEVSWSPRRRGDHIRCMPEITHTRIISVISYAVVKKV